jgi:hypothetical protein
VTQLYSHSFASVHAIDVSPSMLATFPNELPTDKFPSVTHSLHTLSASSSESFQSGSMKSPIQDDKEREVAVPRSQWDVAVSNLVLHHVDDIPGFMAGLTGLVVEGGWVIMTEFTNLGNGHKVRKVCGLLHIADSAGDQGWLGQRAPPSSSRVHGREHHKALKPLWPARCSCRGARDYADLARRPIPRCRLLDR